MAVVMDRTPSLVIRDWLDSGWLAPQPEPADKAKLREPDARERMRRYAAGISPVAESVRALVHTDPDRSYSAVVNADEQAVFLRCLELASGSPMVVAFNRGTPDCYPIDWGDEFGPGGSLGLMAVTLQAGYSEHLGNATGQLGLVFTPRSPHQAKLDVGGYVVLTVKPTGTFRAYRYKFVFDPEQYFRYKLDLAGPGRVIRHTDDGGRHFDYTVGFPGATDYFADALPRLGQYFTALAEQIRLDAVRRQRMR